ncbi:methylated-DNA--[protein]-cysteine S-methyltransferase [Segnochrobactraceae bacterium EtOH-i3]
MTDEWIDPGPLAHGPGAVIAAARDGARRPEGADYDIVRRALAFMGERWRGQPDVAAVAAAAGVSEVQLTRALTRWAGITPKQFLQAQTLDHARRLLRDEEASLLETALEVGLSGPARLHDLFVTHEAMTPGDFKSGGERLVIRWGWIPSPFGQALAMVTDRGLAGLAFADAGQEAATLAEMTARWPKAAYIEDDAAIAPYAARIFNPDQWRPETPLRIVLIGSDFEVRVWSTLLKVPFAAAASYTGIARTIGRPTAARAVGSAVGRNPISFVVPCHRILGSGGSLCGYHWGLTRKRAILGWEAGLAEG